MENLLHYIWKHKIFPLHTLQTMGGQTVEVVDPGLHNSHAGPDFFNAKLKIDNTLWVGNVEIHTNSSDWNRHGHHHDEAYDSVILHVVACADSETFRTNGELIPQLLLDCPQYVRTNYKALHKADISPACHSIIPRLSKLSVNSWLTALQSERFEQKTEVIKQRLADCNSNWEDAFFITLARYLGVGLNGDAFESWAMHIPFRAVDKVRDDLFKVEAIFLGMAGFLQADSLDEYGEKLKKEFHYLSKAYSLHSSFDAARWKFLRLRPDNFPHVRLAQLAHWYCSSHGLFSKILEATSIDQLREILVTNTSDYWKEHYNFNKTSVQREKKLGVTSQNILIINAVVPFLYAYGLHRSNEVLCERASTLLEELKAENNYITRQWSAVGINVSTAADSQALIQLHKNYCEPKKCLYCRFGYEYLRRKD